MLLLQQFMAGHQPGTRYARCNHSTNQLHSMPLPMPALPPPTHTTHTPHTDTPPVSYSNSNTAILLPLLPSGTQQATSSSSDCTQLTWHIKCSHGVRKRTPSVRSSVRWWQHMGQPRWAAGLGHMGAHPCAAQGLLLAPQYRKHAHLMSPPQLHKSATHMWGPTASGVAGKTNQGKRYVDKRL